MFTLSTFSIAACAAMDSTPAPRPVSADKPMKVLVGKPQDPDGRHRIDGALLQRIAGGDRAAFGELYDRFARPLYSTAVHILRDPSEAQDVVHDAFIAIWEKAGTFDASRGTAFSWALTLTRNRAIDRLRSRRRRSALLEGSAPSDLGLDENAAGPSADSVAETSDQSRAVRAAVDSLPLEQQHALRLAFFGGLTQEEIATQLQAPLGTIKARIRRGLLRLREHFSLLP